MHRRSPPAGGGRASSGRCHRRRTGAGSNRQALARRARASSRRSACPVSSGYRVVMATEKEVLRIGGREVTVTNPRKVYFPETGHTKLDLVRLLPGGRRWRAARGRRPADGAQALRRRRHRASRSSRSGRPRTRPDWIRTAELTFPSGRTADEIVIATRPALAWVVNLGCIDLNPHPVRAEDLDHPDELRVDLDPGARACRGRRSATWRWWRARRSRRWAWSAGPRRPARAGSTSTSGSSRAGPSRRSAAPPSRSPATWSGASPTSPPRKWWKEERHGVFLDYNQNAKDRTVASAYSVRPLPDARVSTPLTWDEVPTVEAEAFTIDTVPARYAAIGDPGPGHRRRGRVARGAPGAERPPRGGGAGRRALAAELRQAGRASRRGSSRPARDGQRPSTSRVAVMAAGRRPRSPPSARRRSPRATPTRACRPSGPARGRPRPAAARARSRSSRSPGPSTRTRRSPASSAGRRATPRSCRSSSRRTSWSIRCAAARRPGPACGSTSSTSPRRTGRPRSRSSPTSTRGRARTSRPGRPRPQVHAPASRHRSRRSRRLDDVIELVGIDHVQLSMPPGGEAEARRFYGSVLGLREVAKPAELAGRGGCWFAGRRSVCGPPRGRAGVQAAGEGPSRAADPGP